MLTHTQAINIAKQGLQSTIWSWWLWLLLWALATVLTVWGTADYRYSLTVGLWRLLHLMALSWLLAFVGFGGMSIGLRFPIALRDALLQTETFRWSGRIFALVPLIWGVLTVLTWKEIQDPWMRFPGGPSFRLQAFLSRHPGLLIIELDNNDVCVRYKRTWVYFQYRELVNATLRFEPCGDWANDAGLGGLPAFPNSKCVFRVRRESPEEMEVRYVFEILNTTFPKVTDF